MGFTNTVEFCEQARVRLVKTGGGVLCVFSSVAGDRARKPVILYGAAKAGLSYYLEGLDLKFRGDGLRTVLVKPGFVRTGMTEGLKEPPFAVDAEAAALAALKASPAAGASAPLTADSMMMFSSLKGGLPNGIGRPGLVSKVSRRAGPSVIARWQLWQS